MQSLISLSTLHTSGRDDLAVDFLAGYPAIWPHACKLRGKWYLARTAAGRARQALETKRFALFVELLGAVLPAR